ncbi:hypothetical protein JMN32_05400 [Fulvivirga sp. 29W222]|uniref:Uncharacterized protein n=1 Tax=Fulvivirga marina TaxID=2494733 RepID=A0A937FTY6_9BACT|nr:hypothetical protein [Fulvivirga marina]MBL6445734.1 hypothetical protein [Fulvivirga marina]
MELEEGFYKVKQFGVHCLMEVIKEKGKLYYSMGAGPFLPIHDLKKYFSHPVEIIKKVSLHDPLINVKVKVMWQDMYQHHFEITSTSTKHLRKIFDTYPQLLERLKSSYSS